MAEIVPFRGVLYNPAKVGDLNKVMAPPYDVISPKKQDELYERHPNNIIRIILGKTTPENTRAGPKADRLKLMQACDANMSCIFTLYSDPVLRVNKLLEAASAGKAPDIDVTDDDGIVNRIWRVEDQQTLSGVMEAMKDKSLFIADGHHRNE